MITPYCGTGRRKTAVARVRLAEGTGQIFVNKKKAQDYFSLPKYVGTLTEPLVAVKMEKEFDIHVNIRGGGQKGQAGAIRLGISRALAKVNPDLERILRAGNFVTVDSRVKERKKYGQRGARRGFQFSKR